MAEKDERTKTGSVGSDRNELTRRRLRNITGQGPVGKQYSSNGQRTYFTATSNSGGGINYQGGPTGGMNGGGMMSGNGMRLACANCHGPDGHGGQVTIGGQTGQARGTACRNADGSWTPLT